MMDFKINIDYSSLTESDKVNILISQPHLATLLNVNDLKDDSKIEIIDSQASIIEYIDFSNCSNMVIAHAIRHKKELLDIFNLNQFNSEELEKIVCNHRDLYDNIANDKLSNALVFQCIYLKIKTITELSEYEISLLTPKDFVLLLKNRFDVIEYCDFSKFELYDAIELLRFNPDYIEYIDMKLLLKDEYDYFALMSDVILYRPKLLRYFDLSKFGNERIDRDMICKVLDKDPSLINDVYGLERCMNDYPVLFLKHFAHLIDDGGK